MYNRTNYTAPQYRFRVGQDQTWDITAFNNGGASYHPSKTGANSAIKKGSGESNTITVLAIGSIIYLYVNNAYITSFTSTLSLTGKVGMFAADSTNATDVSYQNAQMWVIS